MATMTDNEVPGCRAAARYVARYNPVLRDNPVQGLRELSRSIAHMRENPGIIRTSICGYLVERDGEGDLRVWVDPDLWAKAERVR